MSRKIILALLALIATACSNGPVPDRPSSVPPSAEWVGGDKGGSWIECEFDSTSKANRCHVYNENTGRLKAEGLYVLRSTGEGVRPGELSYSFFDGRVIGLMDGRLLVPTSERSQK